MRKENGHFEGEEIRWMDPAPAGLEQEVPGHIARDRFGSMSLERPQPGLVETEGAAAKAPLQRRYGDRDRRTWRRLFEHYLALLSGRAATAFLHGVNLLGIGPEDIPRLPEMNERLHAISGWRVVRVPGLLRDHEYYRLLSRRIFPSVDAIRTPEELDFTPEPDCFHHVFGHMPMLTHPAFADFCMLLGQVACRATGTLTKAVERIQWFCVEYGLVEENGRPMVFGASIATSNGELFHALGNEPTRLPFDIARITDQDFETWHLQDVLFVAESYEQMLAELTTWAGAHALLDS